MPNITILPTANFQPESLCSVLLYLHSDPVCH